MVNSIIPNGFIYNKIIEGNVYLINSLLDVPADGSANVHIKNPHNDKVMWIVGFELFASGSQEFYLHDQFNSITNGTEIPLQNALMNTENGGVDDGPFRAYENTTYDSKTSYPVGFGVGSGITTSAVDVSAEAIAPNRQAVVEFRNQDSTQRKAFFGAVILSSY